MKILSRLLCAVAAFSLASCIELSSIVTVNKDGSGTVEETVLVGAQLKAMLGSVGQSSGQAEGGGGEDPMAQLKSLLPDKAKAEENAKTFGEGVTVKSVEAVTTPDGRSGSKVTYAFTDINKLKYQPGDPKQVQEKGGKPITFTFASGALSVNIPQGSGDDVKAAKPDADTLKQMQEVDAAQLAMMKPMLAGMKFSYKVKSATGIASTDAVHQDGDTVTIMSMEIDKLFDKPESLQKFMQMMNEGGDPDPKKLAAEFRGVDGIKVEDKEKVSIKLK